MLKIKSPAKINLGLEIVGKKDNGYHLLDTIFAQINLYDVIYIEKTKNCKIEITSNASIPLNKDNIVWKALVALGINSGLRIHIEKKIPIGGGLGGGSSNAAAILNNADKLVSNVKDFDLELIAKSLGADVYYCYVGGIQRGTGIGQDLSAIKTSLYPKLAILPQPVHASTYEVFKNYQRDAFSGSIDNVEKALISNDIELLTSSLDNSLEKSFLRLFPEYQQMLERLRRQGLCTQITGSGSTFYVILKQESDIIKLKSCYDRNVILCEIIRSCD